MTNEQRRVALAMARQQALEFAELGTKTGDPATMMASQTWSLVAQAMKDGDPDHDKIDGAPVELPLKIGG